MRSARICHSERSEESQGVSNDGVLHFGQNDKRCDFAYFANDANGPHLHIEVLDGLPDLSKLATLDFAQSGVPFGFKEVTVEREGETTRETKLVPRRMDILSPGAG